MNRLVVRFWTGFVLLAMILGSYAAVGASSAPIPVAVAKIYYVSTSGNDAGTGVSSSPFRTIQKCLNIVVAGDTCLVTAGTYNESLTLKTSGIVSLPITVKCAAVGACTVNSGNAQTLGTSNHTHYYTFDGLRFISAVVTSQATLYFGQGTVWSKNDKTLGNNGFILRNCYVEGDVKFYGHNNLVENCEFNGKNIWNNGITDWYATSYDNTYRNNFIHGYKVRSIWSMQYTDNILIEGNTIVDGHIDCDGAGHPVTRCNVRNNIIHDAGMDFKKTVQTKPRVFAVINNPVQQSSVIARTVNAGKRSAYEWHYKKANESVYAVAQITLQASYTFSKLVSGTRYHFRVKTITAKGAVNLSNEFELVVL